MKRILVTGGLGYVGSRLVEKLLREDNSVAISSRHKSSLGLPEQQVVQLDVNSSESWLSALNGVDLVIHLVSPNEQECRDYPDFAEQIVYGGVTKLIENAVKSGLPDIIYLSTLQVYGTQPPKIISEMTRVNPQNSYSLVHLLAEQVLQKYPGRSISVRLANSFGAPANPDASCWNLVSNSLMREVVKSGAMSLKSSGNSHRNFIPMSDVVEVLTKLSSHSELQTWPNTLNLGLASSKSVLSLAENIRDEFQFLTGKSVEITTTHMVDEKIVEPFALNMSTLESLGIRPSGDFTQEIRSSLKAIMGWFS